MQDNELRKLSRADLLEILYEQGKELDKLREETDTLKKQLNDRTIKIEKAGSIAEASFQLNGVFEAAQAASSQYLENIQKLSERQESICSEMERISKEKCERMERETSEHCQAMLTETQQAVDAKWSEISHRLESFYEAHQGLRELINMFGNMKTDK